MFTMLNLNDISLDVTGPESKRNMLKVDNIGI